MSSTTSPSGSTSTGFEPCDVHTLDVAGQGAVVLRTEGEIAFFNTEDGRIMRGDLETGDETLLATGAGSLGDLAVFDGFVYFADASGIWRVPVAGGTVKLVIGAVSTRYAIAVDATGVYWVEGPGSLASHEIYRLTWDAQVITLAENVQLPLGLSVGPLGVVYTDPYDWSDEAGTVRRVGIDAAGKTLVADGVPYPELPFQRDGVFYWVEASDENITNHGGIAREASDGSGHEKVFSFDGQYPVWAMTDGAHYFATVIHETNSGSQLIAGAFPIASGQTLLAEATDAFFTMVATTPKRIVWTQQKAVGSDAPVDGVRSLCRSAFGF